MTERENIQLVLDGYIPEWVPVYMDACWHTMTLSVANKPDAKGVTRDVFGVEYIRTDDGPMPNHANGNLLDDVTEWRNVVKPRFNPADVDWEQEAKAMHAKVDPEGKAINLWCGGIWEKLHHMMGMENAFMALMAEPEEAYNLMGYITDFYIDVLQREFKYLKPELCCFTDHMTTDKGLLLSLDTYRELIKPHEKRLVEAIRNLGGMAEIHIDGYIEDILPDLAEIGVQVIQPFQVFNDINAAKEKYGIICVGGWDAFGPGNKAESTEEDARNSVRLAMDSYAPGGRYIFWESGATPAFKENTAIIHDEAQKYGRTFYSTHK